MTIARYIAPVFIAVAGCNPVGPDTSKFQSATAVANSVEAGNIMPWVQGLAAVHELDTPVSNEGFPPKDPFPSDHLTRDSATAFVVRAFTSLGYSPSTVVLGTGPQAAYNVVAEWPGGSRAGEVVLIACHHDGFYSAADDNSSAVAAVLETARAVRNFRFARTIRFVSFDLEEFGSIGSTRYIQAGYAQDVVKAIVMDMIGFASHARGSQQSITGLKLPDTGDFLLVVGNENSASMTQQVTALGNSSGLTTTVGVIAPGDGTYFLSSSLMRSDHGLLWYRGIPAIFFTDCANFRNPHYHKPEDVPSTLDPNFLANNTRLLTAALALFAEVEP
jgi:Zn-dependent M28 family amino/carboxypeptidase